MNKFEVGFIVVVVFAVSFVGGSELEKRYLDAIRPAVAETKLYTVLTTDEIVAAINECNSRTEKLEAHWFKNEFEQIVTYQCWPVPMEEEILDSLRGDKSKG